MRNAIATALFLFFAALAVLGFISAGFLAALYGDAAFLGAFAVCALCSVFAAIASLCQD